MQLPLQVTFRGLEPTESLEALVREKAAGLDRFADDVMSCRVVAELAGKHHRHGNQYAVRIDLTLPGGEIAVTRSPEEHAESRDLAVAIRDAFDAAYWQLEDHVGRRREA